MRKAFLLTALASASLVATGTAFADPGGGQGRGGGLGAGAAGGMGLQLGRGHGVEVRERANTEAGSRLDRDIGVRSGIGIGIDTGTRLGPASRAARSERMENRQERLDARTNANVRVDTRDRTDVDVDAQGQGSVNSQGPFHASPTAIANANENSVLASFAADLPDLTTGLTVNDSAGVEIGTVSQIVTGTDGQVRMVFVTDSDGRVFRVAPTTLTVEDAVVTVNADAELSAEQEVSTSGTRVGTDARVGTRLVTDLSGLTTGLTVLDPAGAEIGTISRIATTGNGRVRTVFVTLEDGSTIRLRPSALDFVNGVVTTSVDLEAQGQGRVNSQGPFNASPTAIANANANSVLASFATDLPGLTTGLTVNDSAGVEIGTVSQVVTGTDGRVRMVFVTDSDGRVFRLMPTTLTVEGEVVTTTSFMPDSDGDED